MAEPAPPLDAELLNALGPVLGELISATVREAVRRERHSTFYLPGTVSTVVGPDAFVLPDTGDEEMVGTRMHPDIDEGSRVMIVFGPAGLSLVFGPIPQA